MPLLRLGILHEMQKKCPNKTFIPNEIEEVKKNTRRFAKRQLTWFRKDTSILWFDFKEDFGTILKKFVLNFLKFFSVIFAQIFMKFCRNFADILENVVVSEFFLFSSEILQEF